MTLTLELFPRLTINPPKQGPFLKSTHMRMNSQENLNFLTFHLSNKLKSSITKSHAFIFSKHFYVKKAWRCFKKSLSMLHNDNAQTMDLFKTESPFLLETFKCFRKLFFDENTGIFSLQKNNSIEFFSQKITMIPDSENLKNYFRFPSPPSSFSATVTKTHEHQCVAQTTFKQCNCLLVFT